MKSKGCMSGKASCVHSLGDGLWMQLKSCQDAVSAFTKVGNSPEVCMDSQQTLPSRTNSLERRRGLGCGPVCRVLVPRAWGPGGKDVRVCNSSGVDFAFLVLVCCCTLSLPSLLCSFLYVLCFSVQYIERGSSWPIDRVPRCQLVATKDCCWITVFQWHSALSVVMKEIQVGKSRPRAAKRVVRKWPPSLPKAKASEEKVEVVLCLTSESTQAFRTPQC